jgi:HK97 family phage prohead protease
MTKRLGWLHGTLAAPTINDESELTFTASSEGTNRYGFALKKNRWKIDNFNANPVILWMHMDHMPPIGRGRSVLDAGGLKTTVTFDRSDPFAVQIENKYRNGFLNAVSVGFDFVDDNGAPIDRWWSLSAEQIKNEAFYDLAEVSAVPVPADPGALVRQRHALAFDFGLRADTQDDRTVMEELREIERMSGGSTPPAFPIMPSLPGNSDLERRLSKIEEALSRLAPVEPTPEVPAVEDEPVEDELDAELASTLLASLSLDRAQS